jgi:uncharacterized protein (TIGR00730 family)
VSKVCVFCGARFGTRASFRATAREFGRRLADAGIDLVYGGGRVGLMGEVADAVLAGGGYVTGVIPAFLNYREVVHPGMQHCHTVTDLFERKSLMMDMADAFVALPGGIGTFDELLEVIAWRQLRQLDKPIGLLNVDGYFDPWLEALRHAATEGFLDTAELDRLLIVEDPVAMLERLAEAGVT